LTNTTILQPGDSLLVQAAKPTIAPTQMNIPTIAVINESTVFSNAEADGLAVALQTQMDRDFSKSWGLSCRIVRATRATAPVGSWWLSILDDTDMAGALGYHDLTPAGLPLSKIFAKTDKQYGLSPTVTASHELCEMLVDPFIRDAVIYQTSQSAGYIFAQETADPVEADVLGYQISGVQVSDFVTPAWFAPGLPGPWDFMRHCTGPLQLTKGGYISFMKFSSAGWQQATARDKSMHAAEAAASSASILSHFRGKPSEPRAIPQPGSRRERRARGPKNWERSVV